MAPTDTDTTMNPQNPQPTTSAMTSEQMMEMIQSMAETIRRLEANQQAQTQAPQQPAPQAFTQTFGEEEGRRGTVKLHDPAEFGGDDEDDARRFIMDCDMNLDMNAHVYNTDARKIIYVLSHMRTGTAAAFKEYTVHQAQTKGYCYGSTSSTKVAHPYFPLVVPSMFHVIPAYSVLFQFIPPYSVTFRNIPSYSSHSFRNIL